MIEDERIVRLQKQLDWFKDENSRLKDLKEKRNATATEYTEKNQKLIDNKKYLEGKVKSSIRYVACFEPRKYFQFHQ